MTLASYLESFLLVVPSIIHQKCVGVLVRMGDLIIGCTCRRATVHLRFRNLRRFVPPRHQDSTIQSALVHPHSPNICSWIKRWSTVLSLSAV